MVKFYLKMLTVLNHYTFLALKRSFIIAGIPGIVIGFIILLTVREPRRSNNGTRAKVEDGSQETIIGSPSPTKSKFKQMVKLMRPSLLLLCLASSIRNAGRNFLVFLKQI